ncbi:nitroreductase family deazaflavin-dependent oxidoreductase [Kitasatospora purpeofusca]|uniref:nitroreductase family deazaflavin-dependent oxidoreductase n=1 Tax=Kitasatospora purpeofusca TaxID=67352 RepID=UPI0036D40CD0
MSTTTARVRVTGFQRFGNKMLEVFHGVGLPVGPMRLLKVKGRKSGREYTNPVAPVKVDGALYILQAFPGSDWVKNVRAAGEGVLLRGRKAQRVQLVEVPPHERGPIVRQFPTQVPMGAGIFVKNGVVPDKRPESFERAARDIPVFRVVPL